MLGVERFGNEKRYRLAHHGVVIRVRANCFRFNNENDPCLGR